MTKSTKKTNARHNARPRAAKLETQKAKPAAAPKVEHHKVIRAESFELVDSDGNVRATLTTFSGMLGAETVLGMRDHKGRLRLSLRASEREATLNIFGEREPADENMEDCVPRVRVGYDGGISAIGPHVTIYNGNENECVQLSIDSETGDGDAYFMKPNSDIRAIIDSTGFGVYSSDNETLAEIGAPEEGANPAGDHPPAVFSTELAEEPINGVAAENALRAHTAALLDDIFFCGEVPDTAAQALLLIIDKLVYREDGDECEIDDITEALRRELFARTGAGDQAIRAFATQAKKRYIEMAA